jgi:tetratricopeptide (TPR) repeat protein
MRRATLSLLVVVLSLLPISNLQAQTPSYRLHSASIDEYFSTLAQIARQLQPKSLSSTFVEYHENLAIRQTVGYELLTRYGDLSSVKFDTLYAAATVIPRTPYVFSQHGPQRPPFSFAEPAWHSFLLDSWLRENHVDLSLKAEWHIKDYTLKVTPVDFNGDGINELIVEVIYKVPDPQDYSGYDYGYHDFWVLARDRTQPTGYRRIKTPVPYFSDGCGFYADCGGDGQTISIGDVTGDGLPEWTFAVGRLCGSGQCGGYLLVMGWRHGELVNLISTGEEYPLSWSSVAGGGGGSIVPSSDAWSFHKTSSSLAQVLTQHLVFEDNRDCQVSRTTTLTWSPQADAYRASLPVDEYADSSQCSMRRAHTDMLQQDFGSAIEAYQRVLDLFPTVSDDFGHEERQYAAIRLALAYALNHQPDQARSLIGDLSHQAATSRTMQTLIDALKAYKRDHDRISLCASIYNALTLYNPYDDTSGLWLFGETDDVQARPLTYGSGYSPSVSGCDVYSIRNAAIKSLTFPVTQSPRAALEAADLRVDSEIQIDLNSDGRADWLVWTNGLKDRALVFVSDGQQYHVSEVPMSAPTSSTQFSMMWLPAGAGLALTRIGFGEPYQWSDDNVYPCGPNKPFGSINIWQLYAKSLRSIGAYLLCQPRTTGQIFPKSGVLDAWSTESETHATETAFLWNSKEITYEIPSTQQVSQDATLQDIYDCSPNAYGFCGFTASDGQALTFIDKAFANPPKEGADEFFVILHYWRALILEKMGRNQAALTDYIAVVNSGMDTPLGLLAKLHLDITAKQ